MTKVALFFKRGLFFIFLNIVFIHLLVAAMNVILSSILFSDYCSSRKAENSELVKNDFDAWNRRVSKARRSTRSALITVLSRKFLKITKKIII